MNKVSLGKGIPAESTHPKIFLCTHPKIFLYLDYQIRHNDHTIKKPHISGQSKPQLVLEGNET